MNRALIQLLTVRVLQTVATLWLASILFFLLIEAMPFDFAIASATRDTTQADIEALRHRLGLYDSAPERYARWLFGLLTGDMGESWMLRKPIAPVIYARLWQSLWLVSWALVFTLPLAIGLAFLSVARRHGRFDRISSTTAVAAMSVPDFIVAYMLMYLLAIEFKLVPAFTFYALDIPFAERLRATTLPVLSLAIVTITPIFRMTRASLLNELEREHIQMAKLKGLGPQRILFRHVLPNAAAPIVNAVVLTVANLFFGLVIIETIFSYPGLGQLVVKAALLRDMPLLLACGLVSAVIYTVLISLADVIGIVSNPRRRYPAQQQETIPLLSRLPVDFSFGPLKMSRIQATVAACLVLAAGGWSAKIWWEDRVPTELNFVTAPAPVSERRDKLTVAALNGDKPDLSGTIHYNYFKPYGRALAAKHTLEGRLQVPRFKGYRRGAGADTDRTSTHLPGFETELIVEGEVLLPVNRDRILVSSNGSWNIILSAGKVWHEPDDGDWSRGAFPFTMIAVDGFAPYYGVITFLFNATDVSQLRLQIAQETANWAQFDLWGQTPVTFLPGRVATASTVRSEFRREQSTRLTVKPWADLARNHWRSLETFDGKGNRHNISVSALMVDDQVFLRDCRTRAGPHPFCRGMRHGVFSITKSLGAGVSLFWLAHKYGPDVLQEKLVDHVEIPATHDGWKNVTFAQALNMVTGIGNIIPRRVDHYVEADSGYLANRVWSARSAKGKLAAMGQFANYPWGPGEVFRYRSSDTTALSLAMDSFLKKKKGPSADLWDSVTREVLNPLGISRVPVARTREADGKRGVATFASGMYITYEEALKLARLLQDFGEHDGRQLLHRELVERAMSTQMDRGYPNGWRTWEGVEGHYELSFWLHPNVSRFRCSIRVPTMSGYGGNYINIMPNRTIGLRFADGHDDDPHTWDSYGIRSISHRVRSLCQ